MSKNQHILVWRLSAMGDVAMTVPVLKQLITLYPNTQITVVSKPFFEPIFKGIHNLNFVAADVNNKHKGILGLLRLFKSLKAMRITHFADLHNVLRSKVIRNFFKASGVPVVSINKGRAEKKELTKERSKKIHQLKTTHQRYADVFTQLGFPIILKPIQKNKLPITPKISSLLEQKPLKIGIAPFAAFQGKVYPLESMKKVLIKLSHMPCQLFLFGGGQEEANQLKKMCLEIQNTKNIAGILNFEEELILISQLDLMISMDSGNGHLAAMFGVDVVTIWGVTHPFAGFAPFMQPKNNQVLPNLNKYPLLPCSVYGNKVFDGYHEVMNSIDPDRIVESVKRILQKKSF